MVTANLSVGLKTGEARKELLLLKEFMQKEMKGVLLSINDTALTNSVQAALKKQKFGIGFDALALRAELGKVLNETFATKHRVDIDQSYLTGQVRAAVTAGLGGMKLNLGAAAGAATLGAASVGVPDIKAAVTQAVSTAVDDLARSAALMAAQARKLNPTDTTKGTARVGLSETDDLTGERTSYSKTLPEPAQALEQIRAARLRRKALIGEEANAIGERQALLRRARQNEAGQEANAIGERRSMRARMRAEALGEEMNDVGQRQAMLKARVRAEADALRQIQRFYANARIDAAKNFSGAGIGIAAAGATAERFGTDPTAAMLGRNAGLLNRAAELDEYTRKTKDATGHKRLLTSAMNDAHSAARGLASGFGAMWLTWGRLAPLLAGAAVSSAFVQTVKMGASVEHTLEGIRLRGEESTESIARMRASLVDLARDGPFGPQEVAGAFQTLVLAGLNVQQAMAGVKDALNLAVVGDIGIEQSAKTLVTIGTAYTYSGESYSRVADIIAKTAAVSKSSVEGLTQSFISGASVGKLYGVTLEDTATAYAGLSQLGIEGTSAGTSLKNFYKELSAETPKVRKELKSLGVELISPETGKFKGLLALTSELSTALSKLGTEERALSIARISNERGLKTLVEVLNLYEEKIVTSGDATNKLAEFNTRIADSFGFAAINAVAMSMTVENQMKTVKSNLQTTLVEVFKNVEPQISLIARSLKGTFASNEFKDGVVGLASAVSSLTMFLAQNIGAVTMLAAAYAALRAGMAISALFTAAAIGLRTMTTAATAATGSLGLLRTAMLTLPGIGVVLGAAAAAMGMYALWTGKAADKTKDLADAYEKDLIEGLDKEIERLKEANQVMILGKSIRDQETESIRNKALALGEMNREQEVDKARSALNLAEQTRIISPEESPNASDPLADLRENVRLREADLQNFRTVSQQKIDILQAESRKADELARVAREKQAAAFKESIAVEDEKARRERERLTKAESRGVIEDIRQEEAALRQRIKLTRELQLAKYPTDGFGPFMSALISEQSAREGLRESIELEQRSLARLAVEKAKSTSGPVEDQRIDNEIQKRKASVDSLQYELEMRQKIDAEKSSNRAEKDAAKEVKYLTDLDVRTKARMQKTSDNYALKLVDPVGVARAEASTAELLDHAKGIAEQEDQVLRTQEARAILLEEMMGLTGGEAVAANERWMAADAQLNLEQRILEVRKATAESAANKAGNAAASAASDAQSAEYGMLKFWTEYRSAGESNAKAVYDTMKTTTTGMTEMFGRFVTTGKLNFRDFVTTVIAEAARVMAARAVTQLLSLAGNLFLSAGGSSFAGAAGGGAGAGAVNGSAGFGFGSGAVAAAATGGVIDGFGHVPLNKYRKGGVARRPQIALFGEGRKPEAYVPLEDGRTIPVTVSGGQGGTMNVHTEVHVHAGGKVDSKSDSSGQKAAQLGKMIEGVVFQVIVREKRPGGLLAA